MEGMQFWRGWRDAQWTRPHEERDRDYSEGREEAREEIDFPEFEGGLSGFEVVTEQELRKDEDVRRVDALWARMRSIRRTMACGRDKPRAWRLAMVARWLVACSDYDQHLVRMLRRLEAWRTDSVWTGNGQTACQTKSQTKRQYRVFMAHVDRWPYIGRYAGNGGEKARVERLFADLGLIGMQNVRASIDRVRAARERGERKEMEREARSVRLSLADALHRAMIQYEFGVEDRKRWNGKGRMRDVRASIERWEQELYVAMGG